MIFPLLVIALLALIPLVAYGEQSSSEGLVFSMCSLTYEEPYYDCDVKWVVVYAYERSVVYDFDGNPYAGFAFHSIYSPDSPISVCEFIPVLRETKSVACGWDWIIFGTQKYDSCWDGNCKTMLWHELLHLKCKCNWHIGMERTVIHTIEV